MKAVRRWVVVDRPLGPLGVVEDLLLPPLKTFCHHGHSPLSEKRA